MVENQKKQDYAAMLLDPNCRLTKKEMAKELGVCTSTLRNWERQGDLEGTPQPSATHTENEWAKLKSVLYEKALGGDVPAAKLLLQMRDMNLTSDTARGITLEEALDLISDYLKRDRMSSTTSDSGS